MIELTVAAADKFKEIAVSDNVDGQAVRVRVIGGGCAGFGYDMEFTKEPAGELDEVFVVKNVTLIVDPVSHQYLDGVEIDYVTTEIGAGFKFNNPNSKGSCGCGSSFSV
jgi:iron-sulfur cluster insertion protein